MNLLGFKDPDILKNLPRDEIDNKMAELQTKAMDFEEEHDGKEKLAIFIIYIGNRIQRDYGMHKQIFDHF